LFTADEAEDVFPAASQKKLEAQKFKKTGEKNRKKKT
jgi:hypothetical protein